MFEFDFGADLPDLFAVRLSDAMENIIHVDNELATVWGGKEFLRALSSRRCHLFILKQTNGQQRQGLHRRLRAAAAAQLPLPLDFTGIGRIAISILAYAPTTWRSSSRMQTIPQAQLPNASVNFYKFTSNLRLLFLIIIIQYFIMIFTVIILVRSLFLKFDLQYFWTIDLK